MYDNELHYHSYTKSPEKSNVTARYTILLFNGKYREKIKDKLGYVLAWNNAGSLQFGTRQIPGPPNAIDIWV